MTLPLFQLGDTVRARHGGGGDSGSQELGIAANIGELDRGHLAAGQKVAVTIIAVSGPSPSRTR